jgi:2,3-bisphosphoglycerate-dependent phosphoglycerate mutase
MGLIYLVRHAHSDWSPDEQRPLSAKGHADAQRVAEVLAPYSIRAIYSSPYTRARQTVEPLAARLGLPITEDRQLRERHLSSEPLADFLASVKMLWENPTFAFEGGESNIEAQQRGVAVVNALLEKHPRENIVLATHGNLLALILQHFGKMIDVAFWQSMSMPDVYSLSFETHQDHTIERLWKEAF